MPNGAVMVGVGHKCSLVDFLVQGLQGRILTTLKFVAHHRHLRLTIFIAQQQFAHAIGFHVDYGREVLAAQSFIIVGAVKPGRGVVSGACAFQYLIDVIALAAVALGGALEHQVFQNVGGAGTAGNLVFRTDPVGHHEGQRRARMLG